MINFCDNSFIIYKYDIQRNNTIFHPKRGFFLVHDEKGGIESGEFFAHHSDSNFFWFSQYFCFEYVLVYIRVNIHIYKLDKLSSILGGTPGHQNPFRGFQTPSSESVSRIPDSFIRIRFADSRPLHQNPFRGFQTFQKSFGFPYPALREHSNSLLFSIIRSLDE